MTVGAAEDAGKTNDLRIRGLDSPQMCYLKGMSAKTFEDLIVWQRAYRYVLSVYAVTEQFPKARGLD